MNYNQQFKHHSRIANWPLSCSLEIAVNSQHMSLNIIYMVWNTCVWLWLVANGGWGGSPWEMFILVMSQVWYSQLKFLEPSPRFEIKWSSSYWNAKERTDAIYFYCVRKGAGLGFAFFWTPFLYRGRHRLILQGQYLLTTRKSLKLWGFACRNTR